MMVLENLRRLPLCLVACLGLSCSVYDAGLLKTDAGAVPPDAGSQRVDVIPHADASSCVPRVEVCNGVDDDCDGESDETASVESDCASRVLNAKSICQMGKCVWLRECTAGFFNCDGRPDNGCESRCPCPGCTAGDGSTDAG